MGGQSLWSPTGDTGMGQLGLDEEDEPQAAAASTTECALSGIIDGLMEEVVQSIWDPVGDTVKGVPGLDHEERKANRASATENATPFASDDMMEEADLTRPDRWRPLEESDMISPMPEDPWSDLPAWCDRDEQPWETAALEACGSQERQLHEADELPDAQPDNEQQTQAADDATELQDEQPDASAKPQIGSPCSSER